MPASSRLFTGPVRFAIPRRSALLVSSVLAPVILVRASICA